MDTSYTVAARTFIEHEGGRIPDFSACLILLPHHHAGVAFRRALSAAHGGRVLLPPRLMTLPEFAATATVDEAPEPDSVRLAELQHFLAKTGQVPRAALWTAAQELLALLDELDQQGLDLPDAAPLENRHLSLEAGITHRVWQAFSRSGPNSRRRDYALRLTRLAAAATQPLYTLGLAGLTRLEQDFLAHWPQAVIDLPMPPRNPLRRALLQAAWDTPAPALAERGAAFAATHAVNPLAACRTLGSDSENRPRRDQFSTISPGNSRTIAQEMGEKWAGAVGLQPEIPKSDRLPEPAIQLLACPNLEAAALAAESRVLDWLAEGRRDIAIVALDRLAARRLRALLERRDILVQDETGWAFSTAAASHVLDRWLNVVMDDAWFRDLIDLIKSPFAFTDAESLRATAAESLERAWRRHGAPQGLAGHLALARQENLAAAQTLLTRIEQARGLFRDSKLPLADWTRHLLDAFDQLAATPALKHDPVGRQLLTLLATLAQETRPHARRFSLAEWRRWLYLHLEQATFADHRVQSPIRLTHLNAARLRDFEGLIILGVDAGHLPGARPASLFNDATRIQLGLPAAAEREGETRAALADVLDRAERVALIWQAEDAGEERPLSPWLLRLAAFQQAGWGSQWVQRRSPDAALRNPGSSLPPPNTAPIADHLPQRITVSAWQSLVACPYQFFARHLLGLDEQDEVPEEMDKADYGSLVHQVLAEFHGRHPLLLDTPRETLQTDLHDLTRAVFTAAEARGYLAGAWRLRWEQHIASYLDWASQREADGYRFQQAEAELSRPIQWSTLRHTRLEGRADRLDRQDAAIALLDYKTQSKQSLRKKLDETAENVQLTAYAWLAEAAEAGFVSLDDDRVETLTWPGDLATAAAAEGERLTATFTALAAGAPLPANAAAATCAWCEMRGLCRREHLPVGE